MRLSYPLPLVAPAQTAIAAVGEESEMPLPPPAVDLSLPAANKLNHRATSAILDDLSVDREVRVAVVQVIENSGDAETAFEEICREECFAGPPTVNCNDLVTGRALLTTAFERGLSGGWFGNTVMLPGQARDLVNDLRATYVTGGDKAAGALVVNTLGASAPVGPLNDRVTWHFFDDGSRGDPLSNVSPDLAKRLALPSAPPAGTSAEYVVLEVPASVLPAPCAPRFTDCLTLHYLQFWRPGGQTAPQDPALIPLSELVDRPMAIGRVVSGVAFVICQG